MDQRPGQGGNPGGALVGAETDGGSGWWATLSRCPSACGPHSPLGTMTWAPGARVSRQGFHQPQAPASLGECIEEKPPGP